MSDPQTEPVRPIYVTIPDACRITGESRAGIYNAIKDGELTPVKSGARTLLVYSELEKRCAARPIGLAKAPAAAIEAARQAREKKQTRRKHRRA